MKRYFILGNPDTLEVCLTLPTETQPENSLPFDVVNFHKPVFNQYPNPTAIVEGATEDEIKSKESEIIAELKRQQYVELLETDWYVVRFAETGVPIPQEVIELRNQIRNKYESI
jgi:hypothetical protein